MNSLIVKQQNILTLLLHKSAMRQFCKSRSLLLKLFKDKSRIVKDKSGIVIIVIIQEIKLL